MKHLTFGVATFAAALNIMPASEAHAALPCYQPPRFAVSATEVVDGKTGLIWQRGIAPAAKTWADAKAYCSTLGGNYRLPSVKELLTIVDFSKSEPAIDLSAFPGTPSGVFWTSSTFSTTSALAWYVFFNYGYALVDSGSSKLEVRCVR